MARNRTQLTVARSMGVLVGEGITEAITKSMQSSLHTLGACIVSCRVCVDGAGLHTLLFKIAGCPAKLDTPKLLTLRKIPLGSTQKVRLAEQLNALRETIAATLEARGAGKINDDEMPIAPKTNLTQIRRAPGFVSVGAAPTQ